MLKFQVNNKPKNMWGNQSDLLASQEMEYGSYSGISLSVFKLLSFKVMELLQCPTKDPPQTMVHGPMIYLSNPAKNWLVVSTI